MFEPSGGIARDAPNADIVADIRPSRDDGVDDIRDECCGPNTYGEGIDNGPIEFMGVFASLGVGRHQRRCSGRGGAPNGVLLIS